MSSVTNIMILSLLDDKEIELFHQTLKPFMQDKMPFQEPPQYEGGDKYIEATILAAAFNYMDHELFVDCMERLKNVLEEYVFDGIQVLIKKEHDERWSLFYVNELRENIL